MFKIIQLSKRICIACKYFNKHVNLNDVLVLMINQFMHNKVIHNAGLFVVLTSVEHVQVLPAIMNKSDIFVNVSFQCLVFTLVEGETLVGTVSECTPQGININLKFFKSIFVDSHYLPTPSKYEHNGRRWIWIKKIGIDEYYFTINAKEEVRFKILVTKYNRFNLINQEKAVEPIYSYATFKQELLGAMVWWE